MKRIAMMALVLMMVMSNLALAEDVQGDVYYFQPEGWPTKHWVLMTEEEISAYEQAGWHQEVGVLWVDGSWNAVDISSLAINDVENYYNQGYQLEVLYTWTCPASVLNKYQEQSVSVGTWCLSRDQAKEYLGTFTVPTIHLGAEDVSYHFETQGYYNGMACGVPDDEMDLSNFVCARYVYELHDFLYGSKLYIRNGEVVTYTFEEILGGLDNEIPWHAWE